MPTSIGYDDSLGMVGALPIKLNSRSTGVAVANIDKSLESGYLAVLINR